MVIHETDTENNRHRIIVNGRESNWCMMNVILKFEKYIALAFRSEYLAAGVYLIESVEYIRSEKTEQRRTLNDKIIQWG